LIKQSQVMASDRVTRYTGVVDVSSGADDT